MKPTILFREIGRDDGLGEQRAAAHDLLFRSTGKAARHSETGRPIIDGPFDVSISHTGGLVCVGIVPDPYRIGVDVEDIRIDIDTELFLKSVMTEAEVVVLGSFCKKLGIPISSGIPIFWSIKESFFKCLDHDLKPKKIGITGIDGERVEFECSDEIVRSMKRKKLTLSSASVSFDDTHIRSRVVMRSSDPDS